MDIAQILQGLSEGIRTSTAATNNQPVPQMKGAGILDILGMLTKSNAIKDSSGMDQWGNPVPVVTAPKNAFWDMLTTGGQGARQAAELNKQRAQLEQGLRLAQLQQALDIEKENLRSKNTQTETKSKLELEAAKQAEIAKLLHDLGLATKDGVPSVGLSSFAERVAPIRTRTAVSDSLNRGLLSESTGKRLRGYPSELTAKLQEAMDANLIAQQMLPATEAAKNMTVRAGEGDLVAWPNPTGLLGGFNRLEGGRTTRSQTGESMRLIPGGGVERIPASTTETYTPGSYTPAPLVDPTKVLQGKQAAQGRVGEADVEQPEAPSAPLLNVLQDLTGFPATPTAEYNFGVSTQPQLNTAPVAQQLLQGLQTNAPSIFRPRPGTSGVTNTNVPSATVSDLSLPSNLGQNSLSALLNFFNAFTGNPNRMPYK